MDPARAPVALAPPEAAHGVVVFAFFVFLRHRGVPAATAESLPPPRSPWGAASVAAFNTERILAQLCFGTKRLRAETATMALSN